MCAGDAIQWVSRWMRVMGFGDFMLLNINDMLKGIRIVNAQYPITQYRPLEKNERHFNVDFRFEIKSVVIGQEEEEESATMDHRKGLLFDVVEKLYTREEQDRWWKRNTEFAPLCVAKVTTGADHSVAISTDQRVWTCGSNSHGQLGHGPQVRNVSTFRLVESLVAEEGI